MSGAAFSTESEAQAHVLYGIPFYAHQLDASYRERSLVFCGPR